MLQTARLQCAALSSADALFILELVNDPGWLQHIGDRQVHDLAAARAYIANGPVASYARNGFGLLRVSLRESGEAVGLCGLIRRETLPQPDIGYAFLQRHAGLGYATEAARAVRDHARRQLHLTELLAITSLDNLASIRVLEKLGFQFLRQQHDPAEGSSRVFIWQA